MRFLKIVDAMNEWAAKLVGPVLLLIMLIAVYEVIRRYFLANPTTWAWEINAHLMCFMGAFAGGYALLKKAHVSVDIIYARFSPRTKALLDVITSPIFFIFVGALVWFGFKEAYDAYVNHQTVLSQFASPLWPVKTLIAVGAVFIFLQGVAKLIRDIRTLTGESE